MPSILLAKYRELRSRLPGRISKREPRQEDETSTTVHLGAVTSTGTRKADPVQPYQVHVWEDLRGGWTVLTNITADATGTVYWLDPGLTPQGRRFYKAVKTP